MDKAHQHASNADDYTAQGLLIPAAEEHYKAAEAFLACIQHTTNEQTKRTLTLLYNDHNRLGKSLQQRIAQLREAGIDPTLPQLPTPSKKSPHASGKRPSGSDTSNEPAYPPVPRTPSRNRLSESSSSDRTIDDSFMVLGGRSDPGDNFNQFWKKLEGMLEQLSQPVAFASAPLFDEGTPVHIASPPKIPAPKPNDGASGSSDSDADEVPTHSPRGFFAAAAASAASAWAAKRRGSDSTIKAHKSGSRMIKPEQDPGDMIPDDDDTSSSDEFYVIPSAASSPSVTKLQAENTKLKAELEATQKRMTSVERAMKLRVEQEHQLREGINHVRREAQRAMAASLSVPRPSQPTGELGIAMSMHNPPITAAAVPATSLIPPIPLPMSRDKEGQFQRRIKDLEDELRICRAENEKQKAMIVRFKERWEKLKDSAKKKRSLKAASESGSGVIKEPIEEEPEPEEGTAIEEASK